jgi:hypothetical protein
MSKPTPKVRTPADQVEASIALGVVRAAFYTLVSERKNRRLRITLARREKAGRGMLRVTLRGDGCIDAWIEESPGNLKPGVVYLPDPDLGLDR